MISLSTSSYDWQSIGQWPHSGHFNFEEYDHSDYTAISTNVLDRSHKFPPPLGKKHIFVILTITSGYVAERSNKI